MERGHEKNDGQTLALQESGRCVALVAVKDQLRHICCRDRVPPLRMTRRSFAST